MSNSKLCVIFCCFFLWRILLHRESKKTVKDESQGKKFHPTNRYRMGTGKYPRHPLTYPRPSTQKDRTSVLQTPWTSDAQWEWCFPFLFFLPFCLRSIFLFFGGAHYRQNKLITTKVDQVGLLVSRTIRRQRRMY